MQERVIGRKVKPKTVKLLEETLDKIFVTRICILWNPPSFCRSTVRPAEDRRALIRQGGPLGRGTEFSRGQTHAGPTGLRGLRAVGLTEQVHAQFSPGCSKIFEKDNVMSF